MKLTDLLTRKDFLSPGWEITSARQKSFYVTGAIWFTQHILPEVTKLAHYEPEFYDTLYQRKEWHAAALNWSEHFSPRQAIDALSLKKRRPLRFIKAAQTILLCEVVLNEDKILRSINASVEDLYSHMKIEPAVYYIEGYDMNLHQTLVRDVETFRPTALRACKQRFMGVFEDMARGYTVTYDLATKFREVVSEFAPDEIGNVVPEIYSQSLGASTREAVHFLAAN